MLRSIGFQLNLWYCIVFFGSLLLLGVLADYRIKASIESKNREIISVRLTEHRTRLQQDGLNAFIAAFSDPELLRHEPFYVRVSDGSHQTLFMHVPNRDLVLDEQSIQAQAGKDSRGFVRVRARNDGKVWDIETMRVDANLWLQVGGSNERREEMLGHLRSGFLTVIGLALVFGVLGGVQLTRRALLPVRWLADTTQSVISSGDLDARVPERGTGDELDELTHLFNRMLEKQRVLIQGMREALDNVAHDLRTPLTRLRGAAELALRNEDKPQLTHDALADCIEESERVLAMLQTLMDISEAETGVMKLDRRPVELGEIVDEIIDLYAHVAQEQEIGLSSRLEPGIMVSADPNRLRQVVGNLLDNALKYTPSGGTVELSSRSVDGVAELLVCDTGVGIAAEDQPKIWQRLYRADKSRSQRGLGLGLSLVKAIVEAHGGSVAVKSRPAQESARSAGQGLQQVAGQDQGHGSTFTVRLPMEQRSG